MVTPGITILACRRRSIWLSHHPITTHYFQVSSHFSCPHSFQWRKHQEVAGSEIIPTASKQQEGGEGGMTSPQQPFWMTSGFALPLAYPLRSPQALPLLGPCLCPTCSEICTLKLLSLYIHFKFTFLIQISLSSHLFYTTCVMIWWLKMFLNRFLFPSQFCPHY